MKARLAVTFLAALAAVSFADDGATPPKPAPTAPVATPDAKKERKTTPEAEAAIKKYAGLLHFPTPNYKTVSMNSHSEIAMLGGEVGCKFAVKEDGDVALDITLPEAVEKQYGAGQLEGIKNSVASQVGGLFKPFLVPADVMTKQYDLVSRVENGKTVIEITRFADKATWDKATLFFNADGLLEKQVGTPNLDPGDPMARMNAGAEIEMTVEYKKRGELYTIEAGKITQPIGDSTVKFTYFEIDGQSPLPKELEITMPLMPDALVVSLYDYLLDGKAVPETARKVETKSDAPPAKTDDAKTPAEPAPK